MEPRSLVSTSGLIDAGKSALRENNSPEAHVLFEQALAIARAAGDKIGEAESLLELAHSALHYWPAEDEGAFARRARLGNEALAIFQERGDGAGIARCLLVKSTVAASAEASAMLRQALALFEAAGDRGGVVRVLDRQALHLRLEGNETSASQLSWRALQAARELGDDELKSVVLQSAVILIKDLQVPRRELFEELLALCEKNRWRERLLRALMVCARLGCEDDPPAKQAYLLRALDVAREVHDGEKEAICRRMLVEHFEEQGEPELAAEYRQGLPATSEEDDPPPQELTEAFDKGRDAVLSAVQSKLFRERD